MGEHQQLVLSCKVRANGKMVSGCTDGVVKVWDLRKQTSLNSIKTNQAAVTLDIHPTAPVFAAWTRNQQQVSVFDLYEGKVPNQIRYHDGLLGQRIGPVNCLRFHPNLLQLASASTDSHISLYGYRKY